MLTVNEYGKHVTTRLLDFFSSYASWQRRLWSVGVVLGLKEVIEASEAVQSAVLSQKAFEDLCHAIEISSGKDPAIGSPEQRQLLQLTLRHAPRVGSADFHILREILEDIEESYLHRWSSSLADNGDSPSPERTARSIASHLLDSGFSSAYLHRWFTFRIQHDRRNYTLRDLVGETHALVKSPAHKFEILVPFVAAPRSRADMPVE
jgi:hypothetical protein